MARYLYAQIDPETFRCFALSNLSGQVEKDTMIPLDPDQDVELGDIYDPETGTWHKPEPEPTVSESAQ